MQTYKRIYISFIFLFFINVAIQKYFKINSPIKHIQDHLNSVSGASDVVSDSIDTVVPSNRLSCAMTWVIVSTVSKGFQDMFENWLYHLRKLEQKFSVNVIAEDIESFKMLRKYDNVSVTKGNYVLETSRPVSYFSKGYKLLMSQRPNYILKFLRNMTNVIFTDADTVWLKDPTKYFVGNYDIWAQLDATNYFCPGFMAIKSTPLTIKIFELWNNALQRPDHNQLIFNRIIKKSKIRICGLPIDRFPSGRQYFDEGKRSNVVIVHNNYIIGHSRKVTRFKEVGLWKNLTANSIS